MKSLSRLYLKAIFLPFLFISNDKVISVSNSAGSNEVK